MFRRIWVFAKQTAIGFSRDNCSLNAAAMSYFALFSFVPLFILIISIIGFFLTGESRREALVNDILNAVPLSETDGRDAVANAIKGAQAIRGPVAAVGLVGTLWSASALFSSIRRSLNHVWRIQEHRPFFRAKLVDFGQVGVLGFVLLSSIFLTALLRAVRTAGVADVGPLDDQNALWEIPPIVVPALLTLLTFTLLYRFVPAAHPHWRDVIPGALLATVCFEALKNAFAFYVANFNDYNVVYGSLAGVLLFLLNTYLASNILLMGAEFARVFERYHAGELDADIHPIVPGAPITVQAYRAVKGLFVRE